MKRYLLNVSYIGTQFRGVQKIINNHEPNKPDPTTIQGVLEMAIHKLKPSNKPCVIPSSRTDAGVHALHSTFHVDLLRKNDKPYETAGITTTLNKYFNTNNLHVQVLKTIQVHDDFHCRYLATSRTYLYRLGFINNQELQNYNLHLCNIPIEEYGRCHFICSPNFDMKKMKIAANMFLGYHDFRTFMGRGSHYLSKMTRRTIQRLDMQRASPSAFLHEWNKNNSIENPECTYWNIVCKSEGFLYNQVRRIVGTLIAVGQHRISLKEVQCMLQVPSYQSWNSRIVPAPSCGLYLGQVEYSSHDLKAFE